MRLFPLLIPIALAVAVQAAMVRAAGVTEPIYRIASVTLDLRNGDGVGPKRSGSLCLPAGSIAWREARPDEAESRDALAQGLRAGGLAIADPGNPFGDGGGGGSAGADRAVRVALQGVRLSACVPPGGLGRVLNHSHAIKGDGVIAVGWQAFARGQAGPTGGGEACVAFAYREEVGTLPRMVLVGLRTVGVQVAAAIQGGPVGAQDERCRLLKGAPLPALLPGPAAAGEGQVP